MNSPNDVYELVAKIQAECKKKGYADIDEQLDGALHAGTSGLEILARISHVFTHNMERMPTSVSRQEIDAAVDYVSRIMGSS